MRTTNSIHGENNIAVTGIGVISPLGTGREAFWKNVRHARSGIKKITHFDTSDLRTNIAGWIDDFDPVQFMKPRSFRRLSRISRMAVAASVDALEDSRLRLDKVDRERIAIVMGTAYGSSSHVEDFFAGLLAEGPRGSHPFLFPETVPNAPASHVAMYHGITGPNTTFCQNAISAENALCYARNILSANMADVVLVGGAEELSAMQYACYDAVRALDGTRISNGSAVTPRIGSGIILGEGAGFLVMERLDSALERGADIYGVVRAGVVTGGPAPMGHYEIDGRQMVRATKAALAHAGVGPSDIGQIDVSANCSGEVERMECKRLGELFAGQKNTLHVTPLKYLMGDFGGAGILRAAAILLSIRSGIPLPAIPLQRMENGNGGHPDWQTEGTGNTATALMTSSTFGGGSSSFVFAEV